VYNAINKTMRISAHGLTVDRIYQIIETLKPSEMSEKTFLNSLLSKLKRKYQALVQNGWTHLGDTRYNSTALVDRIIRTIEETIEDLEMLHELYEFLDQSNEKIARKSFKLIRKKEMNMPRLIL
jgi:DNA-binding PadR family transcriptional regulator